MPDKFLLTGLPRIRSAWFTALFNAHGVPTKHELLPGQELGDGGRCDPMAACGYPVKALEHYRGFPIIAIDRNPDESRRSLEAWCGFEIANWGEAREKHDLFLREARDAWLYSYNDLDSFDTVDSIVQRCTGKPLSRDLFDVFHLLKIEQHIPKARALHCVA